jgi:DNA-binding CsgD family transcriptional regulator
MILRAVETAGGDLLAQAALLPACVEILIAAGALDQAGDAVERLRGIARRFDTQMLAMLADQAQGALDFASGDIATAIGLLSKVRNFWADLGAPYLAARLRTVIAQGYATLGDTESAELEMAAAEDVFRELGAEPDLAAVRAFRGRGSEDNPLTLREREVLARLAEGLTNRETAEALGLSAKTVNRHVENIFNKIGVSTRAAAVAKALKADLL